MNFDPSVITAHDVYVGGIAGIFCYWLGRWDAERRQRRLEREAEELTNLIIGVSERRHG